MAASFWGDWKPVIDGLVLKLRIDLMLFGGGVTSTVISVSCFSLA